MRRALTLLFALPLAVAAAAAALAQQPANEIAQAMVGVWEMSDADRERTCAVTFKIDSTGVAGSVELGPKCAEAFPPIAGIVSWSLGKRDALILNDARGQSLLELIEVEAGTFEGLRPNEGRYVLQNAAVVAASRDKTADQMFGEWSFVSRGNALCGVSLANTAADTENFAIAIKPGCDALVENFDPAAWKMDRGQLVLLSRRGQAWRFEESDPSTWQRVPQGRQPLALVRQ